MAENALQPAPQELTQVDRPVVTSPTQGSASVSGQGVAPPVPLLRSVLEQPGVQKTLPAIVLLFGLAALALLYTYVSAPAARPMFPDLSESDRQVAYDALLSAGNYGAYLDKSTGQLMIPENEYFDARLFLASQNIPRSASSGGFDEILANGFFI